jgi:hypothetical protein
MYSEAFLLEVSFYEDSSVKPLLIKALTAGASWAPDEGT